MKKIILAAFVTLTAFAVTARENVNQPPPSSSQDGGQRRGGNDKPLASCSPSTAQTDLDINNVRTVILINGDMWWRTGNSNAVYEIPKDSKKNSLFAGAIWIGGLDPGKNVRTACQTYRQSGYDFWPGPVDTTSATISADVCSKYDRHFKVKREEVEDFILHYADPGYVVPDAIKNWPGNGDPSLNQGQFLAPFYSDPSYNDGKYDYTRGDFPEFYFEKLPAPYLAPQIDPCSKDILLGDVSIWWVFNDVGNVHTETEKGNGSIGIEVHAQAFAFTTNDEINNMTFYRYKIINRNPTMTVSECYFGTWVDADLGNYNDDYVGCDVKRGFGYCYNADADDDGALGYGLNPPAVGLDFFQGPLADVGDLRDNDRDSCIDCSHYIMRNGTDTIIPDSVTILDIFGKDTTVVSGKEQIIMSKFVYYNNDFSTIGNPVNALDYYNYLKGIWKDGKKMTYGGNGHGSGTGFTTDTCDFMFPGDSDPYHWGTNGKIEADWDEYIAGNPSGDRRFMQSSGPFTLVPGAVNYITSGAVWARTGSGGPLASVQLVRNADDFAQALFNNCFRVLNGPDAPDVNIRELDREIIMSFTNENPIRNNYRETYAEKDPNTSAPSNYFFEGYQVFQLRDQTVSTGDIFNPQFNNSYDPSKARPVAQFDKKNGTGWITNFFFDPEIAYWNGFPMVKGADMGLKHTLRINQDLFATGDQTMVNHKTYYFMVIAYAYNANEVPVGDPATNPAGRNKPYLAGRNNITVYTAIPHNPAPEAGGLVFNASYGEGPEITRLQGSGNGYVPGTERLAYDLKQDGEYGKLFYSPYLIDNATYQASRGPIDVRIYDPVKVRGGDFEVRLTDTTANGQWIIAEKMNGVYVDIDTSVRRIGTTDSSYDQLFPDYGFLINISQTLQPGKDVVTSGFIESSLTFADSKSPWLSGVPDMDGTSLDWITSNTIGTNDDGLPDKLNTWQKLIGGTWAPYRFVSRDTTVYGPALDNQLVTNTFNKIANYSSIDVIITSDRSKWSKCVVLEERFGTFVKCFLSKSGSLKLSGNDLVPDTGTGFSYFPGYAVNVETGERLNIVFGEDSRLTPANGYPNETGGDMIWNPSSSFTSTDQSGQYMLGGKHVIYVFNKIDGIAYDGCNYLWSLLKGQTNPNSANMRKVWQNCMWVGYPLLDRDYASPKAGEQESYLDNTATVRIRVTNPYRAFPTGADMPRYRFNTSGLVPLSGDLATAKNALQLINVVPNPYYAYSQYEKNQLDNRIKIVNLPSRCTITIFTPNGTFIRKIKRDVASNTSEGAVVTEVNAETSVDWDLKNEKGIPVASGIYLIHVEAPGVGERTIKFFGVLRPADLDTF